MSPTRANSGSVYRSLPARWWCHLASGGIAAILATVSATAVASATETDAAKTSRADAVARAKGASVAATRTVAKHRAAQSTQPSRRAPLGNGWSTTGEKDRPWAKGISSERQDAANRLFEQGNRFLKDSLFRQAVEKYEDALVQWDHPAIRYNMALALLSFEQPIEVHHHLKQALRYGEAPLGNDRFNHAKLFLRLVEKQLSRVDIRCDVEGATVSFDGRVVFRAPGRFEALVRSGSHVVVASKPGLITDQRAWVLGTGETIRYDLTPHAQQQSIWPTMDVVAGIAVPTLVLGGSIIGRVYGARAADAESSAYCQEHRCAPAEYRKIQAAWVSKSWSTVGYVSAGVGVAGGLGYLLVRVLLAKQESAPSSNLAPVIASEGTGISLQGVF